MARFASIWLDSIPFPSQNRKALSIITTWECSLAWLSPRQCLSIIWKGWSGPKFSTKSQVVWVVPGSTGAGIPLLTTSLVLVQPRTPWLLLVGFVEDSWQKQLGKAWTLKFTTESLQFFWKTNNSLQAEWDSNHDFGSAGGWPWKPWATFPWPLCHWEPGKCPQVSLLSLKPPGYRDLTCYCCCCCDDFGGAALAGYIRKKGCFHEDPTQPKATQLRKNCAVLILWFFTYNEKMA